MAEAVESMVQELKVILNEVVERVAKLSKISHEMYFMTRLVDDVYAKVRKARDVAEKVERLVEEGRYGGRQEKAS
jgi:t-SNARE complex subunit (syntaxin)